MNVKKKLKFSIALAVLCSVMIIACNQSAKSENAFTESPDFEIKLGKVSRESVFANDSMSIWGGSLVKGGDGLYHMYYSFWPKKIGWEWVTNSVIAHAVSDSPFGPFEHKDVALPDRGSEYWDGSCTHNPTIHKFDNKYYLYYMGNTGDENIVSNPGKAKINWIHRNNQRIGVAVADNPNGPWKRFDEPVLDITKGDTTAHDALMTSNPAICQMKDGRFLMIYKAVGKKYKMPFGGPVVHMVAIADSPLGPFKKYSDPIFTIDGEMFPAEDPSIWYQDGKYRAVVKSMNLATRNRDFSLSQYESNDGINWTEAKYFVVSDRSVTWEDGTKTQFAHLERPQVYQEDGVPTAILFAADSIDQNNVRHSFNIQIPVEIIKHNSIQ
ncbi:MAG: glycoside hydrolase family protein [Cyclobacteriaceae bacterium]